MWFRMRYCWHLIRSSTVWGSQTSELQLFPASVGKRGSLFLYSSLDGVVRVVISFASLASLFLL